MSFAGNMIRKYRKEKGWTQKQLGEMCGINESNIRKYELGTQNPKIDTLKKISSALGMDVFFLIEDSHDTYNSALPLYMQRMNPLGARIDKTAMDGLLNRFFEMDPANPEYLHVKNDIFALAVSSGLEDYVRGRMQAASARMIEITNLLRSMNESGQATALEVLRLLAKRPEYQKGG